VNTIGGVPWRRNTSSASGSRSPASPRSWIGKPVWTLLAGQSGCGAASSFENSTRWRSDEAPSNSGWRRVAGSPISRRIACTSRKWRPVLMRASHHNTPHAAGPSVRSGASHGTAGFTGGSWRLNIARGWSAVDTRCSPSVSATSGAVNASTWSTIRSAPRTAERRSSRLSRRWGSTSFLKTTSLPRFASMASRITPAGSPQSSPCGRTGANSSDSASMRAR